MTDKRKKRADAGRSALTRDEAALISATLREATRKNGKRLYSIADAVETLRANGFITAGRTDETTSEFFPLSEDAISRALRNYGLHRNNWMPLHHIPKWPVCIPIMSGRLTPHSARFTT